MPSLRERFAEWQTQMEQSQAALTELRQLVTDLQGKPSVSADDLQALQNRLQVAETELAEVKAIKPPKPPEPEPPAPPNPEPPTRKASLRKKLQKRKGVDPQAPEPVVRAPRRVLQKI